ncbi:MAG TPA: hypothetical protein VKA85_02350 [Candidatus Limnocylindrales bacterium]|nr:hypothetical protein [Candidatus Limnocylindrales bacterium]
MGRAGMTQDRPASGTTEIAPGLDLVAVRPLVERQVDAWLPLAPGDRPLVAAGDAIAPGTPLAERLRDTHVADIPAGQGLRPGSRWTAAAPAGRARGGESEGELLFESSGRWRIAAGEASERLESPVAGIVRDIRPGMGIAIRAAGAGLRGALALGGSARGRLDIATGADGELMPRALDVGASGAILVVGARIEAEALTRARAMGVRGIVVAALATKERRDFLASEARQRAALHRLPPLAVLVLHGLVRRPISAPVMALLERIAGRDVAIVGNPPRLVFDPDGVDVGAAERGVVHVRSGPLAGQIGRWEGLAGLRRFPGGTHLNAAFVRFGDEAPVAVPISDLERDG